MRDADNNCVRNGQACSLSSGCSTNVIHSDMYGQFDIEITLAPACVLRLGCDPSNNTVTQLTTVEALSTTQAPNLVT
jgi:hypothetical protein